MANHLEVFYDSYHKISHGKIILVDADSQNQKLLTGSTNLYWKDIEQNLQLNLLSTEPGLIKQFKNYFEQKINESGHYYRFWRGAKRELWTAKLVDYYSNYPDLTNTCLNDALSREGEPVDTSSLKFSIIGNGRPDLVSHLFRTEY